MLIWVLRIIGNLAIFGHRGDSKQWLARKSVISVGWDVGIGWQANLERKFSYFLI